MKVQIMNTPYYDNITLHKVGSIVEVADDFDFGRMGNFGRVEKDGSVSVPRIKTAADKAEPKPKTEYVWDKDTKPGTDAPIFPKTAGVKVGSGAGGPKS